MANFQFPNPADSTTVTNPETGAVYQWLDDPGKWVLTQVVVEPPSSRIPFMGRYTLVAPDDFNDTPGTATIKTEAYEYGDDTFLSPIVKEFYFAGTDLDGKKHEQTDIYQSFDVTTEDDEGDDSSNEHLYTSFYVKSKVGFSRYVVDRDVNTLFNFKEGQLIYYRSALTGNYVSKTGDEMSGKLVLNEGLDVHKPAEFFDHVLIDDTDNQATEYVLNVRTFSTDPDSLQGSHSRFGVLGNGTITVGKDSSNPFIGTRPHHAVSKQLLDDNVEVLQNEIIELEEEIEALAPSLERGTWRFNPLGTAGVGQFGFFAIGTPTNEFPQVDSIFINTVDSTGASHSFADVAIDSYIEVFDSADADFGLYQVNAIYDETAGANSFWHFDVTKIRSNRPLADVGGTCRFKFFDLAEGADAGLFVLKAGDEMSGTLTIDRPQSDSSANSFIIKGRVNTSGTLTDSVLFKDYRRGLGSNSSDYITYYGSGGGDYEVMNRKAGDNRFVGISNTQTISGTKTFSSQVTLSSATSLNIKGKLQVNGTTTASRYLGTTSTGALEWKSAPTFTQTKANWTQTSTTHDGYIQNKPTVVEGSKSGIKITSSNGNYYIQG